MFKSKNKKNEYPCKPQFYYIKVGCKGAFISRTCLDINANVKIQIYKSQLSKKEGLHYMDMFDSKISQN